MPVPRAIARAMIASWLRSSSDSWKRRLTATDSPHLHAPGVNADRLLLVGDGVATGRGVITHELGLPGHLARALSARTGRATDVDIIVHQDMTVTDTAAAIRQLDLARFDTIVLSLGHSEALTLTPVERWRTVLTALLDEIDERTPLVLPVSILGIPVFGPKTALPPRLAAMVDQQVERLNTVTADVIADRSNVTLITSPENVFEPETSKVYRRWADTVAGHISAALSPDRIPAGDTATIDETQRQLALQEVELSAADSGDTFEDLITSARHVFETPVAAITFIHSDYQSFRAVQGSDPVILPRNEAFCDVTIRRGSHLVVEDATADPRYAHFGVVTGALAVKFYAGYPIESPDGHRVGALCVMDTKPRQFTDTDLAMLRSMALLAQGRLWPAA